MWIPVPMKTWIHHDLHAKHAPLEGYMALLLMANGTDVTITSGSGGRDYGLTLVKDLSEMDSSMWYNFFGFKKTCIIFFQNISVFDTVWFVSRRKESGRQAWQVCDAASTVFTQNFAEDDDFEMLGKKFVVNSWLGQYGFRRLWCKTGLTFHPKPYSFVHYNNCN